MRRTQKSIDNAECLIIALVMPKTKNDLVRIASAGGGFNLSCATVSTDDLIRIAAAASILKPTLTFTEAESKPIQDLVRIAAAGKGCVQFVF